MSSFGQRKKQRGLLKSVLSGFLAATRLRSSTSVVSIYKYGTTPTRFDDIPAGFGPKIPEEGFAGRLQLAKPNLYGCSPLDKPEQAATIPTSEETPTLGSPPSGIASVLASPSETHAQAGAIRGSGGSSGSGRNGVPTVVSRQALRAEILDAVSSTIAVTATATGGGAEELPAAVLISRSVKDDPAACTFEAKVIHAQDAGFRMVIVYDYQQENLMTMGATNGAHHPTAEIPSVFVSHKDGMMLKALIASTSDPRGPDIYVDNTDRDGMIVTVDRTMFLLATGFLLTLLTCGSMMVVTLHRYLRRYESLVAGTNRPMSLPEVLQLAEVRVEEGSRLDGDSCPVCLEPYRIGDRLRGLPCQHAFHAGCITPWLTQRQRTCPMCKDPVTLTLPVGVGVGVGSSSSPSPLTTFPPLLTAPAMRGSQAQTDGEGRGGGGAVGDRLPLLSNLRGAPIEGGSIQQTSPV